VTSVVLPYLIFETALTVFRRVVGGEDLPLAYLDPNWPMWYLTALFMWRLVTPVFKRLPAALPVAVAISLVGGLTTGNTLDLARAMGLLPFFVAGLLVTPAHLDLLRRPAARLSAVGVFVVVGLVALLMQEGVTKEWLYWRSSYAELDATVLEGAVMRLGLLLVGGAAAAAFFALVPRRGGWFARMGAATLVVYLCHGFVVKGAGYAGIEDLLSAGSPWWSLLWLTAAAVLVALVLAWPPVATRLNLVVDPVGSWKQRRHQRPRHRL
jgi:fucose 4-O-acetylase-like acetyltransferase